MKIERRATDLLKPSKANARTHSKSQLKQIARSIEHWGWTQPILIDEADNVLAGHGRLAAAKSIGATDVPVVVAQGWSESQKRAYIIADNQIAANAGWDRDLLSMEVIDLGALEFDLSLTGFGAAALASLSTTPDTGSVLDATLQYSVVVEADGERHQAELIAKFDAEGLKCRALIS